MNQGMILKKTEEYVREKMQAESSGHDWWHVYRVWKNAIHIGKEEHADLLTVQLGALLHDIADHKFHGGDVSIGPQVAKEWLEGLNVDNEIIADVCEIIRDISFKGSGVETPMRTSEGRVVQDADRLDAIGAIGIARAFAYGGYKGLAMYDPAVKPAEHETFEQYKNNKGPSINHFYEKLLLLKDLMNTTTAKEMAEGRHQFMEQYLDRFFKEWEGEE